jgi:predicted ATPase/DNA-binding SARP family transcriptional activator
MSQPRSPPRARVDRPPAVTAPRLHSTSVDRSACQTLAKTRQGAHRDRGVRVGAPFGRRAGTLAPVLFRILGPLEVEHGGRLLHLGRPKQRALLASLLLSANQVVSSDRLIDELWGEDVPKDPGASLQVQISRLRRVLAPAESPRLQSRPPGYVLHVGDDELDSLRFERLVAEAQQAATSGRPAAAAERLKAALGSWRGPALADFVYADFAQRHIARLDELRLVALEAQAEVGLALGRHTELVGSLRALVDEYPLREKLWRHLIVALYRCGRQADALRACAELRERLDEELGIGPSPLIAATEEDVLLQRASVNWRPPEETQLEDEVAHNLPAPRSSLVGREQELTEVEKLLARGRLVTIVGPGGVGKTRLAVEVAHRQRCERSDGVWLAELASLSDPNLVVQAVASAMDVRERPGQDIVDTLASSVQHRQLLLVLDNCEHVVEAAAALVDLLLRSAPTLRVLATSREPLRIEGESVWTAQPLAVPPDDNHPPEALMEFDAVRLFVERAAAQGGFSLSCENARSVAELCRRLDGLPLAVELAAAQVRTLGPSEIIRRLEDRFSLLTSGSRTAVSRHRTLKATVDWSYEQLGGAERHVFARLSVFSGCFSLEAAEKVCLADRVSGVSVLDALTRLVDQSLVIVEDHNETTRYRLLETLREYGMARLSEAGDESHVRVAHLRWCLERADTAKHDHLSLTLEDDHFRQALRFAIEEGRGIDALRLAAALSPMWFRTSRAEEGRSWLRQALRATARVPGALRADAVLAAAVLANYQGDLPASRALAEEAVDLDAVSDASVTAEAAFLLGNIAVRETDYSRARSWYERSLLAWERSGVDQGRFYSPAWVYGNLGRVADHQGDRREARGYLAKALRDGTGLDDCLEAILLGRLAVMAQKDGRDEQARRLLARARRVASVRGEMEIPNFIEEYIALLMAWGDVERATEMAKEALVRAHAKREHGTMARFLFALAKLASADGDDDRAAQLFGAAGRIRDELGHVLSPPDRADQEKAMGRNRDTLADATIDAWDVGYVMPTDEVVSFSLGAAPVLGK